MKCNSASLFASNMTTISDAIVEKINSELGSNAENLDKCENVRQRLDEERKRIEKLYSLHDEDNPSETSTTLKKVESTSAGVDKIIKQYNDLSSAVTKYQNKVLHVKSTTEQYLTKINLLEKTCDYLKLVKEIEDISGAIESGINERNERKQVMNLMMLYDLQRIILTSKCLHMLTYMSETVHYWHNILKDRFTTDFEEVLKSLKWPFVGNHVMSPPTTEIINHFQILVEHLLNIQLDEPLNTAGSTNPDSISLPMSILLKPLRKRFMYHFMGTRQTNRPDKPEWFFTQIIAWVRDHQEFVEKNIQSVYEKLGKTHHLNAKVELMQGLVRLAIEKLHLELSQLQYDDCLFSHAVDEALGFDREMTGCYGYPDLQPGVLEVLTQARIFEKWITLEKRFSCEKMEKMMNSSTVWDTMISPDIDDNHVTECAESFLTLLSTITQRYQTLPQPGHRLRFLELQLYLISDWRIRLIQMIRDDVAEPVNSKLTSVANTANYVKDVLVEWGVNTHFLHLQYYKNKLDAAGEENCPKEEESGTVFDEHIEELDRTKDELVLRVADHVLMEVKAKSMSYRRDKWHVMESPKDMVKPGVSPSSCGMFQTLSTHLHHLQSVLAVKLFRQAWLRLTATLDQFLYEEIPALCHFNEGGALQFQYDVTRNLFPLFAQYSSKPEAHFKLLKDSCVVLTMSRGSALLLQQTLTQQCEETEVLFDIGVHTLTQAQVRSLLSRRTDLR